MHPSDPDLLRFLLERCEKQIETELTLVGARMTWLVISQSFFVTAYVASSQAQPVLFGLLAQLVTVTVGITICTSVRLGINAALRVVEKRKTDQARFIDQWHEATGIALTYVPTKSKEHRDGNIPPQILPTVLLASWGAFFVLLVYRAWTLLKF